MVERYMGARSAGSAVSVLPVRSWPVAFSVVRTNKTVRPQPASSPSITSAVSAKQTLPSELVDIAPARA